LQVLNDGHGCVMPCGCLADRCDGAGVRFMAAMREIQSSYVHPIPDQLIENGW
jgi:hypothetical protein